MLDDLWDAETAHCPGQDDRARRDMRALARWLDIATAAVRYGLPEHLRRKLRPGYTGADVEQVCSNSVTVRDCD